MRIRTAPLARLAVLLIVLFALSACDNPFSGVTQAFSGPSATPMPTSVLSGASWRLTELTVNGQRQTLIPTAPVTLQFQAYGAVYMGSSGCNYYSGAYTVSGGRIHLEFASVTERACVGPIMRQEVMYLNVMQHVRSFQMSDKTLMLKDGADSVILAYVAA